MSGLLRIFEAKALADELTKAGHSISERTAQRWKKGETQPKPQDFRAIRRLVDQLSLGTTKEAPRPAWAEGLESRLMDELRKNREVIRSVVLGDEQEDEDADLVAVLKEDLRPVFEELADQFREQVQRLLDARFGGTGPD